MAWYDSWGDPHATGNTPAIVSTLTDILDAGASVNMYVSNILNNKQYVNLFAVVNSHMFTRHISNNVFFIVQVHV